MAENDIRNQEANRHMETVDRNIEKHQEIILDQKTRGIKKSRHNASVARIINIMYFLVGVIEMILLVRVILHLIGANPNSTFGSFIESISYPFVAIFSNLLQNPVFGNNVLEISTIIAMLVYVIGAVMIGRLTWLALSRTR